MSSPAVSVTALEPMNQSEETRGVWLTYRQLGLTLEEWHRIERDAAAEGLTVQELFRRQMDRDYLESCLGLQICTD